jgi:hypothetical protein
VNRAAILEAYDSQVRRAPGAEGTDVEVERENGRVTLGAVTTPFRYSAAT